MFSLDEYLKNHFIGFETGVKDVAIPQQDFDELKDLVLGGTLVDYAEPQGVSVEWYQSCAGRIPIVTLSNVQDFENLVTNLVYKGKRPENLSSVGASFVSGKTRRFIILSKKPYSNVSAATMGLGEEEWKEKSMIIRREHECTHFFTKVRYGTAQNHLHDELMADFCGIYEAFGEYKAEYFEYFMGLRGTEGNRFSWYVKDATNEDDIETLKEIAKKNARLLETWSSLMCGVKSVFIVVCIDCLNFTIKRKVRKKK